MGVTLVWLTLSLPFVYAAQQEQVAIAKAHHTHTDDDSSNPFANTTEEKAPTSVNLSEEYLHHHEEISQLADIKLQHTHYHSYDVYVAFHGELLSPPPEA